MTQLVLGRDPNLNVDYGIPFSAVGSIINMAAGASASLAVPSGVSKALIQVQPGATVLVGTAAPSAPSGSFAASLADINPALREVGADNGVNTLYFYAVEAAIIKVSFYE